MSTPFKPGTLLVSSSGARPNNRLLLTWIALHYNKKEHTENIFLMLIKNKLLKHKLIITHMLSLFIFPPFQQFYIVPQLDNHMFFMFMSSAWMLRFCTFCVYVPSLFLLWNYRHRVYFCHGFSSCWLETVLFTIHICIMSDNLLQRTTFEIEKLKMLILIYNIFWSKIPQCLT